MLWFCLSLCLFYISHSILAAGEAKRRLNAMIGERWYRIFFNVLSFLCLAIVIWFYTKSPSGTAFEAGWLSGAAGGVFLLFGLIVGYKASMQYSMREFSGISYAQGDPQAGNQLNTEGINGIVRHPLYLSLLLLMATWFCFQPQWRVLAVFLITFIYVPIGIYFEEKKLIEVFGEAYEQYKARVAMLIPGIW